MCERIVLVFHFPVYMNTIWGQAHAGLGVLSTERSPRARCGSGSVWRWLIDQVIIMMMIWKHDHESASGAGMSSVTLDKAEIKKIVKKRLKEKLFTLQLVDFIIIIETSAMQDIE